MKFTLRFAIPVFLVIGFLLLVGERHFSALQERWFTRDLDVRASLIANLVQDELNTTLKTDTERARAFLNHLTKDERLRALAVCSPGGHTILKSENFPKDVNCSEAVKFTGPSYIAKKQISTGPIHVGIFPFVSENGTVAGRIVTVHDSSFIASRVRETQIYLALAFFVLALFTSLITAYIADLSWRGWLDHMRSIVKTFRGAVENPKHVSTLSAYTPIVKDLRKLVRELETKRIARDESLQSWTPKTLKDVLHGELSGEQVIIVSNREPFIHKKSANGIEVQRPASGLVTALEPVMEACSGVWVAHGSGNADKLVVDVHDKIQVPPEKPKYSLRRVWMTDKEEEGYYYGFANEGLWPLCHIAHTRPLFRSEDYEYYKAINQRFADVVCDEAKNEEPVILIQDYHFALMPRMIRARLPRAVIVTFWHIPWPNPEVFGICPWREELLEGLLGSSIVGFHTQFHCNNFFETVDRFLECRVDRENDTISLNGKLTGVRSYPISIEWPPKWLATQKPIREAREHLRLKLGLPADMKLGIGVDRLDYTKGIVERLQSVEALFKTRPEWVGKFAFIQIAAPSRSQIPSYKHLHEQVVRVAEEINLKYGSGSYKPVILKIEHHEPPEVYAHLRASDICYVSSLHDGMNLVAKEFIASREDEQGVLILSSFTGASRELPESLIVNPYNIDQAAECLQEALVMSPREQKERMKSMRSLVSEHNVYRWAGRMLLDASTIKKRTKFKRKVAPERIISPAFV